MTELASPQPHRRRRPVYFLSHGGVSAPSPYVPAQSYIFMFLIAPGGVGIKPC